MSQNINIKPFFDIFNAFFDILATFQLHNTSARSRKILLRMSRTFWQVAKKFLFFWQVAKIDKIGFFGMFGQLSET